jgi:ADP-ribose pyrophosphatase YjhB (NUDIX family)
MCYCPNCGSALPDPPPSACPECGRRHYVNPNPCGEAVVIRAGRVLLLRRARDPWKDAWDVPGGFCENAEHPMHAAERELHEELGLAGVAVAYIGTWIDSYGPPASNGIQDHTANCAYIVELEVPDAELIFQPEEVSDAGWFGLDQLPDELAFPDHMKPMLAAAAIMGPAERRWLPDRTW